MLDRQTIKSWIETTYILCFTVGVRSIRCLKSFVRFTRLIWAPIAHALHRALEWLLLRHLRTLWAEWLRISKDYRLAREHMQKTARDDRHRAFLQLLAMPIVAVRRHRGAFRAVGNVVFPV